MLTLRKLALCCALSFAFTGAYVRADDAVNPFTGEKQAANSEIEHHGKLQLDGTTPVLTGHNGNKVPVSAGNPEVAKKLADLLKLESRVYVRGKMDGNTFKISTVEQADDGKDNNNDNDNNKQRRKKGKK